MTTDRCYFLVLSIYFNTRGFAFVLFEGHLSPFDWGVRKIEGEEKQSQCLKKITKLIDRYEPDTLVTQDTSPNGTRRAPRIVRLNARIVELAEERGIPVYAYSRADVCAAFSQFGPVNKQMIAELIAQHIPAHELYVPPPRKRWRNEHARMGIFDAAALGLVFFQNGAGSV